MVIDEVGEGNHARPRLVSEKSRLRFVLAAEIKLQEFFARFSLGPGDAWPQLLVLEFSEHCEEQFELHHVLLLSLDHLLLKQVHVFNDL